MRVCLTWVKPYIILRFETSIRPNQMPGYFAQQQVQHVLQKEVPQEAVRLSDEERQRVNRRASIELLQLLLAQLLAGLMVALLAWVLSGYQAAISALAGAGAYFLPNLFFALRLLFAMSQPGGSGPGLFLVGEALKILASVALLWLLAKYGGDAVHWLAVFFGLLAVLKSYFLVFVYRVWRGR